MPKSPDHTEDEEHDAVMGSGVGALAADLIPFSPSGTRRAGAARVMAARLDKDPSLLVRHPLLSQMGALAGGGVLSGAVGAAGGDPLSMLGGAALPLLVVQALRAKELRDIEKEYIKAKTRKRLRELDEDRLLGGGALGGSGRLGATSAYETMRKRRYQGYNSLAEAADALHLSLGATPLSVPITSAIDHHAANEIMAKRASKDFFDQRNSPVIPMAALAAALGLGGQHLASSWFRDRMAQGKPLPTPLWRSLTQHVSGADPVVFRGGSGQGWYVEPASVRKRRATVEAMLGYASPVKDPLNLGEPTTRAAALDRAEQAGLIAVDRRYGPAVLAHEAGHAKIEDTPGLLRALQRHVYPYNALAMPLASAGSMAAGLSSGGTLQGALLGTLIGGTTMAGVMAPELMASVHALKGMRSWDRTSGLLDRMAEEARTSGRGVPGDGMIGRLDQLREGSPTNVREAAKDLSAALSTYAAALVLPSVLSGTAGGFISGRRKANRKKMQQEEDADGAEKQAGVLGQLLEAKGHSDAGDYTKKNTILHAAMRASPEDFVIDSDDGRGIVGITHVPTGFRIHTKKVAVPRGVRAQGDGGPGGRRLYTWVDRDTIDSVREKGLLSSEALLSDPDALGLAAAGRGVDADTLRAEIEEGLRSWRANSLQGPSMMFKKPPEGFEFNENHPTRARDLVPLEIDLDALLEAHPDSRFHGLELEPYDEARSEELGDAYADVRHRDLTTEELDRLLEMSPEELWGRYKDAKGKGYYAPDVPHVAVITPDRKIGPEYIRFPDMAKAGKQGSPYKLYYFEGRNTGIAARSEEEARQKKRRGGDKLVAVRTPTEAEERDMEAGRWVRTRADGKPPGKSDAEGRGQGPPPKGWKSASDDSDGKDTRAASPEVEALLDAGSCCGEGCRQCPYLPRHKAGSGKVRPDLLAEDNRD
jgi:hypothetical protein